MALAPIHVQTVQIVALSPHDRPFLRFSRSSSQLKINFNCRSNVNNLRASCGFLVSWIAHRASLRRISRSSFRCLQLKLSLKWRETTAEGYVMRSTRMLDRLTDLDLSRGPRRNFAALAGCDGRPREVVKIGCREKPASTSPETVPRTPCREFSARSRVRASTEDKRPLRGPFLCASTQCPADAGPPRVY